ncbi:MAG: hypothetical protein ACOYT4_05065 [Nanoarchaeota archaeon]
MEKDRIIALFFFGLSILIFAFYKFVIKNVQLTYLKDSFSIFLFISGFGLSLLSSYYSIKLIKMNFSWIIVFVFDILFSLIYAWLLFIMLLPNI